MSIEPRRIKKIIRPSGNPLLNQEERKKVYQDVADGINTALRRPEKALAYALTKPRSVEGYVTLPQLAAERGIQAQLARIWLQRANIPKPGDRWMWKADSKALNRVRKVLGLEP